MPGCSVPWFDGSIPFREWTEALWDKCAATTHAIRAAIQRSQASLAQPGRELGFSPKAVAKWRKRTIKEATVKRFHDRNHDQLRTQLDDFIATDNFARRLKTLNGLRPYEYICRIWTSEPDSFIVKPIHQMQGLNTQDRHDHRGVGQHFKRNSYGLHDLIGLMDLPPHLHLRRWQLLEPMARHRRQSATPESGTSGQDHLFIVLLIALIRDAFIGWRGSAPYNPDCFLREFQRRADRTPRQYQEYAARSAPCTRWNWG